MSGSKTFLSARRRSYRVALTPLADVMFQLLTFFMLTTSLTPYSLLTIRSSQDAAVAAGAGEGRADSGGTASPNLVIWELEDGVVRTGGAFYERGRLAELSDALALRSTEVNVQLIVGPTARIQDVASAMAALRGADVNKVELKRVRVGP